MDLIPRFLAALSALLLVVGFNPSGSKPAFAPTTTTVVQITTTTQEVATPTTTANDKVSAHSQCGQWWGLARELGWQEQDLETLDYIMWRESRCDPTQHNTTRNKDGSTDIGLTQINDRSWCLPTRWYPDGYLQTIGVLTTVGCGELFDPVTNLKAARMIYEYHRGQGQEGFEAWGL